MLFDWLVGGIGWVAGSLLEFSSVDMVVRVVTGERGCCRLGSSGIWNNIGLGCTLVEGRGERGMAAESRKLNTGNLGAPCVLYRKHLPLQNMEI